MTILTATQNNDDTSIVIDRVPSEFGKRSHPPLDWDWDFRPEKNFWWFLVKLYFLIDIWIAADKFIVGGASLAKETNKKNKKVLCCSRTSGSGFWIIRRFECTTYVVTATAHLATLSLRPSLGFLPYCVSGPWWVTPFLWLFAAAAMVVRNLRKIRAKSSHAKQMATHCKSGKLPATSPFTWRRWRRYMQQVMRSHEQVGQATKVPLFGSFLLLRLLTFSNWTVKLPTSSSSDLEFEIDPNHDSIGVSRKKNNPAWLTIITEYIIAEVLLNSSLQPFRSSSFELTRKDEEKKK